MRIGIISAMPSELEYVLENIDVEKIHDKKMNHFFIGNYEEIELICVVCGVGKVNAAVYTQLLIDNYEPDYVINIGIAGGLGERVKTLDLVVGSSYRHHDVNIEQTENLFPNQHSFLANNNLFELIKMKIPSVHDGVMTSGESFIADKKEKEFIKHNFQSISVDMETSSIAHCCYLNEVPFIALRCISDLADDKANDSYENFEIKASNLVGKNLLNVLDGFKIISNEWVD
ncbi:MULTISPECIES: 5'-methylthioadenosine/adenosylhomocysteine nucleosidase [Vagococcus]|uniref:adenosylhomocysteine nucleosidase n=1 Tax=Vagococcus fluvialis bH819 TaxID=1255619 RepID=A0A1X6WR51_9ENTE|nr:MULTISPECIES: 5'-methylthioadenosine/adenosylhomocysteine nucleosidase [Vagococcus]SLM86823.1 5'-methylthioadenosine nucleosidase / S-adenosylhomocysteine nucleosidase [Vagococcus fluvialis bH819]HCM88719.1 5'-methylthioadenosine/adenosylhomocysteine nucleosidase [Vagococcus sp.]